MSNSIKKPLQVITIIFVSMVIVSPVYIYHQNIEAFFKKHFIKGQIDNFDYSTYTSVIYAFLLIIVLIIMTEVVISIWKVFPMERHTDVRVIKINSAEKRSNIEDYAVKGKKSKKGG